MSFVHLHTHSHYSLLDGLAKIPELIYAAKKMKMPAIALTDHGNLYGAVEFYQEATKAGIKPIIGMEAYVAPTTIGEKKPKERPTHLLLLAFNTTGYKNLIQLATISQLDGFYGKPRIDKQLMRAHHDGLIALSGCLGSELARTFAQHGIEEAARVVQEYVDIFGKENYFLEVQYNPGTPEQARLNEGLLALHHQTGVELVATNDVHYISPSDNEAQDVLLCIQTKTLLAQENRLTMKMDDRSFTGVKEMQKRFRDFPRACENTLVIATRANLHIDLENIQIPYFALPEGVTPEAQLRTLCEAGLQSRYAEVTEEIRTRLAYELDIISKTGFASYFLIVQDFINWAKQQGIAVGPGRGSAAGSIVAYLTNITDIDPIRYDLLFERFLNPERVSQPDIDTDFADTRRDDVLRYVEQTYGKDHVAQIITFGTMAARASVRDVGRVLGFSYGYCDRIAKMIPMFTDLSDAVKKVPELREMIAQDSDAQRLISIAKKLEGVARHTSTHACAVVITKHPLIQHVPLQVDQADGTIITQYSMKPIDALGLLKMDFLGLKNLTIIEQTLAIIEKTTGKKIEIEHIPLDDPTTFILLQEANTIGVFQLESSGMRRYLKLLQPTDMEDIIAMVSLYRPGPMEFIPQYIDGKHGRREVTYIHPMLEPILKKTFGIAVYQEQVMEIALRLAGFTYGEADVLRKAVGKKIKSLLDEQEQKMIEGMTNNGIQPSIAKQIWEFILPFARYGFNRSHAACYAMIAYRTAYLKANFPAQFMASLLTADHGNTDRIALEVHHAQQLHIDVLPPDVNESFSTFTVVRESVRTVHPRIRFGLKAIKNVGEHIVDVLIAERKFHGQYQSLEDFLSRVRDKDLNKKSLESLIKCGALDRFGTRNQLLMNMDTLLHYAKRAHDEKTSGQRNLFGMSDAVQQPRIVLAPAPDAPKKQQLQWEKELLGLYISGHPLDGHRQLLQSLSIPFHTLKEYVGKPTVTLVGMVTNIKRITTKSGEPMLFVGFADHTSEIEAIVFPKLYQQTSTLWEENVIVKMKGRCDDKDGAIKLLAEHVERFDPEKEYERSVAQYQRPAVLITVPLKMKRGLFLTFQALVREHPGERHVYLVAENTIVDTKHTLHADCIPQLQELFGQQSVCMVD